METTCSPVIRSARSPTGEAEQESRELALGLLAAGVGKGTRVGLLMGNSPDWILAWFAALRVARAGDRREHLS